MLNAIKLRSSQVHLHGRAINTHTHTHTHLHLHTSTQSISSPQRKMPHGIWPPARTLVANLA